MDWKRLTVDGTEFAYLEEGAGPLVILVHGFPDTARTWDAVRPALAAAGYRVVSPNTRGYWPTAIPADGRYDSDRLGQDVLDWIPALGEREAIVVGHDWGASAAYCAAHLAPDKIRFLVTVAIPHPLSLKPSPRMLWAARHFFSLRWSSAEARCRAHDFQHIDELVQRWAPAWRVPKGETDPVKEAFRQPGCLPAALGYYRAVGLRPPSSLRGKVRVPSAVFSGAHDFALRRRDYEKAARFYEAPHQIVHMDGGHFLHREHPQRFLEELLGVLPPAAG
jgi:pimeloyl-ACP methyl ester carboxylesterase